MAAKIKGKNIKAEKSKLSTHFSDVLIFADSKKVWLEVKMTHNANLGNPRCYFDGNKWNSSSKSPLASYITEAMNRSDQVEEFLNDLRYFVRRKNIKISTTRGGLKEKEAVSLLEINDFFSLLETKYIFIQEEVDLGSIVEQHYVFGKSEPVYYMQASNDFYLISLKNPLNLPEDIPRISGFGDLKVRISSRSKFYEVQPEIKIKSMVESKYSVFDVSGKINPFEKFI